MLVASILVSTALLPFVTACFPRDFSTGRVCLCNATHCDSIAPTPDPVPFESAAVYTSSASGKRLAFSLHNFSTNSAETMIAADVALELDLSARYQHIYGFGGAFTDSVGINLRSLTAGTRKQLLKAYFGESGIGYTLGRVPIASCDFSTRVYSYCDVNGDFNLEHFALTEEDEKLKIPFIQEARWFSDYRLRLFATPWSAPAWMKETGRMQGGGRLKGPMNGPFWRTWAQYIVRFFEEYLKRGINFWGLTVQNEPTSAGFFKWYGWQAMYLNAEMQRDFVRDLLGPQLRNSSATARIKVMINDDNRWFLPSYPDKIFEDNETSKYVDGVAVHWYWNKLFGAGRLAETHQRHPDKFILPTEACNGWHKMFSRKKGVLLGDWRRGEKYATDIIENLENWAVGWVDWNLCVDANGGPSWAHNWVDAPVVVNASGNEFLKQPMFYAIAHFSKFFPPDSVRIGHSLRAVRRRGWHLGGGTGVAATAVLDKERAQVALVVQNSNAKRDLRLALSVAGMEGRGQLVVDLERSSISTIIMAT